MIIRIFLLDAIERQQSGARRASRDHHALYTWQLLNPEQLFAPETLESFKI
jgi:hypothetical protein